VPPPVTSVPKCAHTSVLRRAARLPGRGNVTSSGFPSRLKTQSSRPTTGRRHLSLCAGEMRTHEKGPPSRCPGVNKKLTGQDVSDPPLRVFFQFIRSFGQPGGSEQGRGTAPALVPRAKIGGELTLSICRPGFICPRLPATERGVNPLRTSVAKGSDPPDICPVFCTKLVGRHGGISHVRSRANGLVRLFTLFNTRLRWPYRLKSLTH